MTEGGFVIGTDYGTFQVTLCCKRKRLDIDLLESVRNCVQTELRGRSDARSQLELHFSSKATLKYKLTQVTSQFQNFRKCKNIKYCAHQGGGQLYMREILVQNRT